MHRSLALVCVLLVSAAGCRRDAEPLVDVQTASVPAEKAGRDPVVPAPEISALTEDSNAAPGDAHATPRDAKTAQCLNNLKQLGLATMMYYVDYDRILPRSDWADATQPYMRNPETLVCPAAPDRPLGYAMNAGMVGANAADFPLPGETVLYFEADASKEKPTGGRQDCVFRHDGKANFCFCDGHVKLYTEDRAAKLIWEPGKQGE